jgi:RNA polymerase sigma factor (sigma-70 family)
MAAGRVGTVLRQLKAAAVVPGGYGITDAQLLDKYLTHHSEVAFEAILRRHGPMVLGVCRRVLENHADAEDAFQATFLVLVRKASSIAPRGMVGNWLYGVAYRTSMKARAMNATRRMKERSAAARGDPAVSTDLARCDLQGVLDQELNRLPDKYRAPLVLCDLEGKTRSEVARQIGCPEGTVATRLVKARHLLAKALTRRGLTLSGSGVALLLGPAVAAAVPVPSPLLLSTIKAATAFAASPATAAGLVPANVVALTQGVLKAMSMSKMKAFLMVLFAAGVLTLSGLVPSALPQGSPQPKPEDPAGAPGKRGVTNSFLEMGKTYEFTTPNSKRFQAQVVAIRGEQWIHVDLDGGGGAAAPAWLNLNHIMLIEDVPGGAAKNRENLPQRK